MSTGESRINSVAVLKGLLTFVVPSSAYNRRTGGTESARYCYSVFLRHLVQLHNCGGLADVKVIAEIGPGDSIGIGLAALISGVDRYYGFDVREFTTRERSVEVFDELVALFRARAAIPSEEEFPNVKPLLPDYRFPHHILTEERLAAALDEARLARIREDLAGGAGQIISYIVPWYDSAAVQKESVDWIFSQAVMEHVDDLRHTYDTCYAWLRPRGRMTHQIDFRCHGLAERWNGHWAYSDLVWRLMRGRRLCLLNRLPHSAHVHLLGRSGFRILVDRPFKRSDGLKRTQLSSRFRELSEDDVTTADAFVVAEKPAEPMQGE